MLEPDILRAFFRPRGVAVIGASTRPAALGYAVARNLLQGGYEGAVHLVNPKGGTLFGRPLYPSVRQVPDPVELAVVIVPAAAVPRVLEEVGQRGIRAAIVQSGGFAEVGAEGQALQTALLQTARRYGLRVLGPNCIGILDPHRKFNTTFLPPPPPKPGGVAFLSQSGALAAALLDWSYPRDEGFSLIVSTGNQADLTWADLLPWAAQDPATRVVLVYVESPPDRAAVEALRAAALHKPVVVLQAGRTQAGQRAAASHTAALAGSQALARAAYRRAAALLAPDTRTALAWARALEARDAPRGRLQHIAVLTNAGGPGVLATDALAERGFHLAQLSDEVQRDLRAFLPPAASVANPVDMLASASPEDYARGLEALLAAAEVDGVLLILPPPPGHSTGAVARAVIPVMQAQAKPVVVALMGGRLTPEAEAHFRAAGLPVFPFPEEAAAALDAWARAQTRREAAGKAPLRVTDADRTAAERALRAARPGWLPPTTVAALLDAYRIPRVAEAYAATPEEAAAAAQRIGFPVVLKVHAAGVVHKSDVGGVRVGLRTPEAVRETAQAWQARFGAAWRGVVVQALAPPGHEVIVGGLRDPRLGPVVMLGTGGVEVELLDDAAFALAPLTPADLDALLHETSVARRLRGYRHLPAVPDQGLREVLVRVATLLADHPQLAELDLNPVRVTPQGTWVLDARVRVGGAGEEDKAADEKEQSAVSREQ